MQKTSLLRGTVSPRLGALICLAAIGLVSASCVLQSGRYQDWRLARLPLAALQSELQARGETPRLLYYVGLRLNEAKRFAEADGYLRQGVGLDMESAPLREEWARALLGSGKTTAAFDELKQFVGTHPGLAAAHLLIAKIYYTQRSMSHAKDELDRAIALEPHNLEAHLYLAGANDSLHDLEGARQAAATATDLQPDSAAAHLVLASLCSRTNRPLQETRSEFQKAIMLAPQNAAAHQEYARWLLDTASSADDRVLAMDNARKAIALGIDDSASYLVLGRALMDSGDNSGAIDPLTQAAKLSPDDPASALALSQVFHILKQSKPTDAWRRNYLVRQQNMTEKKRLQQAVIVAPDDRVPKGALARWLGRHGDVDGCAHHYSMAKRSPIDSPIVLIATSQALLEGGYSSLALPLCARAVESARHSPDAHEALGDALLEARRVEAANEEYKAAIRLDYRRAEPLIAHLRRFVIAHRNEPGVNSAQIVTRRTLPQNGLTERLRVSWKGE